MSSGDRRAVIYARISRDKEGAGLGVERQVADCRELAGRMGWTISAEVYADNDLSAYSGKPRPRYRVLLDAIRAGTVDAVITWHTDRLHRSPVELEEWIEVCEPRGVEVHTVKAGPIDLATPAGRMVARQLGAVARYESEHRSMRVASKMEQIAREGGYLGGPRPFGYLDGGMQLEPIEAVLIAEGTRMILSGHSLRSVVKMWNDAGATTTRKGQRWSPVTVRDTLTRARNAGLLLHRGQVVGPGRWEPIVGEDEWRGVCAILSDPARRTSPGNHVRWLGSGIYRCGIEGCEGRLVVGTSGQGRHPSYLCRTYRERPGGRHVTRAAHTLDKYISDVIIARLSMPDAVDLFAPPTRGVDVDKIRAELRGIEAQRTELAAQLGRGEITMAMMTAANAGLHQRQVAHEHALAAATATNPITELVHAPDVRGAWERFDLDRRRAILNRLLEVTVMPAPRGRRAGPATKYGEHFDPDSIKIVPLGAWRHVEPADPTE